MVPVPAVVLAVMTIDKDKYMIGISNILAIMTIA